MSSGLVAASSADNCRARREACAAWLPPREPDRKKRSIPLCLKLRIMAQCSVWRYTQQATGRRAGGAASGGVKNLETNHRKVSGISAATILGDGNVALIIDVLAMQRIYRERVEKPRAVLEEAV